MIVHAGSSLTYFWAFWLGVKEHFEIFTYDHVGEFGGWDRAKDDFWGK